MYRPVICILDRDSNAVYYYRCHQSDWDRPDWRRRVPSFEAMLRAYTRRPSASKPTIAMMGESAAHSSMSTSVSNEQSPSAGHQAGTGGFYFQSLTQLDRSSPSRSSPSASPSTPCTPPTPSTPSGTLHPQLQTCEPIRVINVYEYGKPASYPGPRIFLFSIFLLFYFSI